VIYTDLYIVLYYLVQKTNHRWKVFAFKCLCNNRWDVCYSEV